MDGLNIFLLSQNTVKVGQDIPVALQSPGLIRRMGLNMNCIKLDRLVDAKGIIFFDCEFQRLAARNHLTYDLISLTALRFKSLAWCSSCQFAVSLFPIPPFDVIGTISPIPEVSPIDNLEGDKFQAPLSVRIFLMIRTFFLA